MNSLWEILLACNESGIKRNKIRFIPARQGSPYMELSLECLNQEDISGIKEVEVNTYYRFYEIFKDMFQPELSEYTKLRASLTNLILHMLADNDIKQGMTKEAYGKKMLVQSIRSGCFGEAIKDAFLLFTKEEQMILLSGWLRVYRAGGSLTLYVDMVHLLIADGIVYHSNRLPDEILVYTSQKKTVEMERKMKLLIELFLDVRYQAEIFYEHHFGIMGVDETMIIDEIAMY